MRLENSFEVAAPPPVAWRLLNDVPNVLPCMPGAELEEVLSENAWKAKLHVRLGPIALQFIADVTREEVDEAAGRVVLVSKAREAKGRGGADARIESVLSTSGTGSRVDLLTDLELRGAVAQYGRGVVAGVAARLTSEFANCLARKLTKQESPADESEDTGVASRAVVAPTPVKGLRLVLRAFLRSIARRSRT
jgi:carbon monoxide dehydrogenase subunit G